jgi:hypothetical protein
MYNLAAGNQLLVMPWVADSEQAAVNALHYQVLSISGAPTTDQDVANYCDAQFGPVYGPIINNTATYRGTQCRVLNLTPEPVTVFSNTHATTGSAGAIGMSRQTCGLIAYYTNTGGRKGRGRTYIPFPSVAQDQGFGIPTAGYVALATTVASTILAVSVVPNAAATGSATLIFAIYDKTTKVMTQVTSKVVRTVWATQRRRGSYGRANVSPI